MTDIHTIWERFEKSQTYMQGKGILTKTEKNWLMYTGEQWKACKDSEGMEELPTMNFIKAKANTEGGKVMLEFLGVKAVFKAHEAFNPDNEDVVLGIRPEFFTIHPEGKIHATAYSTLPSGMETTVKVKLAGEFISSVVFGAIDYKVDQPIQCDIVGDQICVFDEKSTQRVAQGSVEVQ